MKIIRGGGFLAQLLVGASGLAAAFGLVQIEGARIVNADQTLTCTSATETVVANGTLVQVVCAQPTAAPTAAPATSAPIVTPSPNPTPSSTNGVGVDLKTYISELPSQSAYVPARGFTVGYGSSPDQYFPVDTSRATVTNPQNLGIKVGAWVEVRGFQYPPSKTVYAYAVFLFNSPDTSFILPPPCGPGIPGENQPVTSACPDPRNTPAPSPIATTPAPSATTPAPSPTTPAPVGFVKTPYPTFVATPYPSPFDAQNRTQLAAIVAPPTPGVTATPIAAIATRIQTEMVFDGTANTDCWESSYSNCASDQASNPSIPTPMPTNGETLQQADMRMHRLACKYIDYVRTDSRASRQFGIDAPCKGVGVYFDLNRLHLDGCDMNPAHGFTGVCLDENKSFPDSIIRHDNRGKKIFISDANGALGGSFQADWSNPYFIKYWDDRFWSYNNQQRQYGNSMGFNWMQADDNEYSGRSNRQFCSGWFNTIAKNPDGSYSAADRTCTYGGVAQEVFGNTGSPTDTYFTSFPPFGAEWLYGTGAVGGVTNVGVRNVFAQLIYPILFNGYTDPTYAALLGPNVFAGMCEGCVSSGTTVWDEVTWSNHLNSQIIAAHKGVIMDYYTPQVATPDIEQFLFVSIALAMEDPRYVMVFEELAQRSPRVACTTCSGQTQHTNLGSLNISPWVYLTVTEPRGPRIDISDANSAPGTYNVYTVDHGITQGVINLKQPSGIYVREYGKCFIKGVSIGGCAAVVNPPGATRTMSTALWNAYQAAMVATGHGIMTELGDDGALSADGPRASQSMAAGTAVLLTRRSDGN